MYAIQYVYRRLMIFSKQFYRALILSENLAGLPSTYLGRDLLPRAHPMHHEDAGDGDGRGHRDDEKPGHGDRGDGARALCEHRVH